MALSAASKVLLVGGLLNLLFAFGIGFVLSRVRLKDPSAEHDWLLQAHRVSLWEGFMLLGLIFAVEFSTLSRGLEMLAAWLLVIASALQASSAVANLVQQVPDQFAQRRAGYYLAATNAVLGAIGLVILLIGVLTSL
jgi:hypothetical protein